jgi:hypothetical protein
MDYSLEDFNRDFPNDAACLETLVAIIYPAGIQCRSCGVLRKHHRLNARRALSCDYCGTHVYPLAGTMFGKSSTPLKCWFYAMYLMVSTDGVLSERELQRELGVAQKTASRIREHIAPLISLTHNAPVTAAASERSAAF